MEKGGMSMSMSMSMGMNRGNGIESIKVVSLRAFLLQLSKHPTH